MRGVYCLLIDVMRNLNLEIGKLGSVLFNKGIYVYVGSGKGSSGGSELINRVLRHLRYHKKRHWHIDYLLASDHVKIKGIHVIETDKLDECALVKRLSSSGHLIPGFGSSDCKSKCGSHLIFLRPENNLNILYQ